MRFVQCVSKQGTETEYLAFLVVHKNWLDEIEHFGLVMFIDVSDSRDFGTMI